MILLRGLERLAGRFAMNAPNQMCSNEGVVNVLILGRQIHGEVPSNNDVYFSENVFETFFIGEQ